MKRIFAVSVLLFCITLYFDVSAAESETDVKETNIENLRIFDPADSSDGFGYIKYGDGTAETVKKGYEALFINGSVVKYPQNVVINNKRLFPLRIVSENLGAEVKWLSDTGEIEIYDMGKTIRLKTGSEKVSVDGGEEVLDTSPKIINGTVYVSAQFVKDVLGAKIAYSEEELKKKYITVKKFWGEVEYYKSESTLNKYIIMGLPHIMISRYDEDTKPISKDRAAEIVRENLTAAYESNFGEYVPIGRDGCDGNEGDYIRKMILSLDCYDDAVEDNNDRYYLIHEPVVFDFWIDKYTEKMYVYYKGSHGRELHITSFEPESWPSEVKYHGFSYT